MIRALGRSFLIGEARKWDLVVVYKPFVREKSPNLCGSNENPKPAALIRGTNGPAVDAQRLWCPLAAKASVRGWGNAQIGGSGAGEVGLPIEQGPMLRARGGRCRCRSWTAPCREKQPRRADWAIKGDERFRHD